MNAKHISKIEFGDFQTPERLAKDVCERLAEMNISPDVVIEPTCGVGSFIKASAIIFSQAREIFGFDIKGEYLDDLQNSILSIPNNDKISLTQADFFSTNWSEKINALEGNILVIGNFPWVTNSVQGTIGGDNLPKKSNFLKFKGFDAISGKSNFDISEWMLLDVLKWFKGRSGHIAMLVKTAVARKILSHAEKQGAAILKTSIIKIDAKKDFGAAVDACLLVIELSNQAIKPNHDYTVYENLHDPLGHHVGHRMGLTVANLEIFDKVSFLVGQAPQKWRSGIKHDASSVMELTCTDQGFINGLGYSLNIESTYLFPLLKGSDIGSNKEWRHKYMLVPQRYVGESTDSIRNLAPKTWEYLEKYSSKLDARGSVIYKKNPRFSIFGVGEYAFRPWRIAICSLYKKIQFRLVEPIENKPVMFDDTVYYLSFHSEVEACSTFEILNSRLAIDFLSSLIFWDEKRPIKTSILNVLDWSRLQSSIPAKAEQLYTNALR